MQNVCGAGRRRVPVAIAAVMLCSTAVASASDRWEEAAGGAVAILPVPEKAAMITGGSLFCAEQRWSLRLRIEREPNAAALGRKGLLTVGQTEFPVALSQGDADITIPVSLDIIDALKAGSRLSVAVEGSAEESSATFSLKGSRAVLEAVAPRCSPIDMSPFDLVTLSPADPAVDAAKTLFADEAKLFRAAAGKQPEYAAKTIDVGDGRQLLFASLCGSTSYYGPSGCTLSGYVRDGANAEWRPVYNTEGLSLYTDPKASTGGWPNLVTLPVIPGSVADHWAWNGSDYAIVDQPVDKAGP